VDDDGDEERTWYVVVDNGEPHKIWNRLQAARAEPRGKALGHQTPS
jgi:hypothetical protein